MYFCFVHVNILIFLLLIIFQVVNDFKAKEGRKLQMYLTLRYTIQLKALLCKINKQDNDIHASHSLLL